MVNDRVCHGACHANILLLICVVLVQTCLLSQSRIDADISHTYNIMSACMHGIWVVVPYEMPTNVCTMQVMVGLVSHGNASAGEMLPAHIFNQTINVQVRCLLPASMA